ncbi:hypothetical protein ACIBOV_26145 [Micromonospora chersina]|uniref:hypothetical protein n=1 Tax=Micromonospora chersina TaxID=47854 RepID=UPI0037A9610E
MSGLSSPLLLAIFLASAGVIWGAGVILSDSTDVLCRRLRLGEALGGVILLAFATNLPEIAITTSAAVADHVDVAVGNILGGIAIQTAVLALLDAAGPRPRRPLTYLAASLTLLLECALVVALLLVVVMSTQLPGSVIVARVTPGAVLITLFCSGSPGCCWCVGLGVGCPGRAAGGRASPGSAAKARPRRHARSGPGWSGWALPARGWCSSSARW